MESAYFVEYPRREHELHRLHLLSQEKPYVIVRRRVLAEIDYENFTSDMLADRQFLEDAAPYCSGGDPFKCLFVHRLREKCGILVVPDGPYVRWAAYVSEEETQEEIQEQEKNGRER